MSAPVFTGGASQAVGVAENGAAVTTVAATDADGDSVIYAIYGGADQALFGIDSISGALSFNTAPDFENPTDVGADNIYDVTVRATAGGETVDQALAVTVTNINAPVFTGGASQAVSVAENGTAVTTVAATDADGYAVRYAVYGGADQALFAIDSISGALSFNTAPDFEQPTDVGADNIYDVTVRATAGGETVDQALAVTVTNSNVLVFTGGASQAVSIAENGAAVTTVSATDADGYVAEYAINGGADQALFAIDPITGALSFNAAPDFEHPTDVGADNIYDVTVRATGGGQTVDQALAVTVTNVNDNAPVFTGGASQAVSVAENGTAVTTVAATDADGDPVRYAVYGGADQALFAIDSISGALSFNTAPDFEQPTDFGADNVYNVTVRATAGGETVDQALAVSVTNSVLVFTSGASQAVNIAENGTAVTTVAATDADGGAVRYAINGGADQALFGIDSITGALSFNAAPDFEQPTDVGADNIYDVTVRATSSGQIADQALAVTVTNVNDTRSYAIAASSDVAEDTSGTGNTITYTVTRNGDLSAIETVNYALTGTATSGVDFTNNGTGTLIFAANASTANFTVTTTPDTAVEGNETVIATISGPNNGGTISTASATASIVDNDVTPGGGGSSGGGSLGDTIGTSGPDSINGTSGNDNISSGDGADTIFAGQGNDTVTAGDGGNIIVGGNDSNDGSDQISSGIGSDLIFGNGGDDTVSSNGGNDTVVGGFGNDLIALGSGNDFVYGNENDDTIIAGEGQNTVIGGRGNDQITSGASADLLFGNEGSDFITAGDGNNTIVGGQDSTDGSDSITAGSGNDLIFGNGGDDTVSAGEGQNILVGGYGNDAINAGAGNDIVFGNQDNDSINAGDGANLVFGGFGDDVVVTGSGNDTIWGNEGNDTLTGGPGSDRFVFAANDGADLINGFSGNEGDVLDFQGQTYAVTQDANGNAVLTLSGGGVVTLAGIAANQVNASFFA